MTVFDKRFNLLRLEEHPDWDNTFDTGDFKILASWFYTHNTTVDSFDRDTMLQYDDFCVFCTQYEIASPDPNVPPGITDDEIVMPGAAPAIAAPDRVDIDIDIDIDIINDEVGTPEVVPDQVTPPDDAPYTNVYHVAILAADSDDYRRRATS